MAGLEAPPHPFEPDLPVQYGAVPDDDAPGCFWVVLDLLPAAKRVGYLGSAEDGTFRAFSGGREGDRLGRVETVDGGVQLVTLYHRAKITVDWCRNWGLLDAMHDRAEDLAGWG